LTPDTGTLNVGDTFDMQVLMDTGGHAADSVNMIVLYDSGVLAVQDTEPLTAGTQISAGSIFPHIITNTAQSSLGEIRYSADGNAFSGSGTLASITFTVTSAIHNTAVEVYYRDGWIGESNIVESGTLSDVLGYANAASFQTIGSPSRPMPTVSFTPASNALVNTSMIQLEAQATDPYSQVREVKFEINLNGIWTTIARDTYRPYWRYLWDASSVPDGVYAIRATALLLGGEGTTATNSNIWLDRTLPRYVSSKIVPPPGPYIGGPVEINAAAADEGSGVDHIDVYARKAEGSSWYFLGSISGGQGDVIWDTSGYSAGTYQIAFSIQDRAGNWGPASQPQHFIKLEAEHKVYLPVVLKNSDGPAPPPVPTPPPTPSSNLLINGSFEDGTYAPDASPDGWTQDAWNWSRVAFLWDDTQAHTGNRSIRITHNDLNDSRWIQTVPVQPNTDYHLSGWIKTENVAHANELVDAGANLSVFGTFTYIGELFGTNDWTYVSLVFNSGDNANVTIAARLGYWAGTTTGTVWFDDLRLEPL
jgi:hypothetical protein